MYIRKDSTYYIVNVPLAMDILPNLILPAALCWHSQVYIFFLTHEKVTWWLPGPGKAFLEQ